MHKEKNYFLTLCFSTYYKLSDTATMSDTEGYTGRRTRPRRRTTGGSEAAADIETARKIGSTSDQEGQSTLNRQQIISMVKKRFGLRPDDSGLRLHPTVPEEEIPVSIFFCVTKYQVLRG